MAQLVINSYAEFESHLGEELGVSDWLEVTQERINLFADATLDVKFESWELIASSKANIDVFSTTGQLMLRGEDCTVLPVIGLPSGFYIVKAYNQKAQVTKKIYLR